MKKLYLMIFFCLFPLLASGQALKGSYFSEYSAIRNKLNPAFAPRANYFGFAALDNLGIGVSSNVGLNKFMFPGPDGRLQTFLHPDITADQFLGKLPNNSFLDLDIDTDILNIGFFTSKNSYWSIGVGLKVDAELNMPKELFSFIKEGAAHDPQEYDIRNFSLSQNAYLEASIGYTHNFQDLVPGLSVGGRLKVLAAADRIDVNINSVRLRMGSDMWSVNTDASANMMLKGLDVYKTEEGALGYDFNPAKLGVAGFGGAIDLGAEYRLHVSPFFDSIRFSAALLDLGFVSYSKDAVQQFVSKGNFEYDGIGDDLDLTSPESDPEDALQQVIDEISGLANFEEVGEPSIKAMRTRPQLLLGVEMPFLWNKMSLGLLYNAKFGYTKTRNELTLALQARPHKSFNLGFNYSMLRTAKSFGWILEFMPRGGINIFLGCDYMTFNYTPQFIPVDNANLALRMGFSIAMGNKFDEKGQARRNKKLYGRN